MSPSLYVRRHFLATLLGTGAATFASAQTSGSRVAKLSPKGENIQFGLVTYMWGAEWDLPTLIRNCEEAQINAVELRIEHAHAVTLELTAAQRAEVRQRFEAATVKPLGMGTNCEFHSPDPAVLKKNIDLAKDYLKLSHDIGGSGIKVKPNALPKDIPVEKTLEQIGKALAELGDHALGFGQEIRLEVHGGVTDLGHIATIMKTAARENVRVCWNSNPEDLKGDGIEANFAKVLPYLGKTVHIREVDTGDYPYDQLAKLLVNADYDGWVCLEARTKPDDLQQALKDQRNQFLALITIARRSEE